MIQKDFIENIENDTIFELKEENKDNYIIINTTINKKYMVKKDKLINIDWKNMKEVLEGRETIVIDGITRIVGYFSKISNWNKSKIGELMDRRKGNYLI